MRKTPFHPRSDKQISQTYNDGIVKLYCVQDTAETGRMPVRHETLVVQLDYENRSVGSSQFYQAAQAQIKIEKVIRVQRRPGVDTKMTAELEDGTKYDVARVQLITDCRPASLDLTLTEYSQAEDQTEEQEDD
jgi:hypothetical protein